MHSPDVIRNFFKAKVTLEGMFGRNTMHNLATSIALH